MLNIIVEETRNTQQKSEDKIEQASLEDAHGNGQQKTQEDGTQKENKRHIMK